MSIFGLEDRYKKLEERVYKLECQTEYSFSENTQNPYSMPRHFTVPLKVIVEGIVEHLKFKLRYQGKKSARVGFSSDVQMKEDNSEKNTKSDD